MESGAVITYPLALGAGLISFVTPCVLPLVPVYLSILSGTSFDELTGKKGDLTAEARRAIHNRVISNAIAFIIGFSVIFIIAGVAAGTFGDLLKQLKGDAGVLITNLLLVGFGVLLLLMGLNQSGVWKPRFLNTEKRFSMQKGKLGVISSGIIGAAFAFGWAPCIGPILAAILVIAAAGSKLQGAALLATYSLGLAIPFFLSALSVNGLIALSVKMRRHFNTVELVIGTLLILFGLFLGLIGLDGFSKKTNGLDLVRQKIPGLDAWVSSQESKWLGEENKEEEEAPPPIEDESGNIVVFDQSSVVDVEGEPIVIHEGEFEPLPDN